MGRHSAAYIATRQNISASTGAVVRIGRVGLLAATLGVGAAIAGGTAVASADASSSAGNDHSTASPAAATAATTVHAGTSARATKRVVHTPRTEAAHDDSPAASPRFLKRAAATKIETTDATDTTTEKPGKAAPRPVVLEVLRAVRQEVEAAAERRADRIAARAAAEPVAPAPTDQVNTPYGAIGTWMIEPSGQISDYGGQREDGKTLLEPVNVIIVDPKAANAFQATIRLNRAMRTSGFPAQAIHSGGFRGLINGKAYRQQPSGLLLGYSDNFFLETNSHGRIFGPAPVATAGGYVWSGAFSEEEWGTYNGRPAHLYVSSNVARTALATKLVASGRATSSGLIALDNAFNTDTVTTGDHDGYAVVLVLT